ncbi:winged helix-turn-helix DNA-binding family protein [Candidatus Erwinia dacicola]|uniref:Winged helix-turn-helix DNA-binding family protein n=1 Tax=Candidatus Erwinia dacicola TaxID=252393 RepID=A0A328TRG1_9GAMM|nr:winged helix-turn-helix transcriptional regulator [Candidatus Erwinia dacicola]RAP72013.1 winged helix-turn-helix DNA-binding family protein [Candidatus Erwinia dacicola]
MDKNIPYSRRIWITTALSLRFNDALTYREIAEQLNISTSATHKMFKRFRRTGINWPLPEGYTPERLEEELYAFNLETKIVAHLNQKRSGSRRAGLLRVPECAPGKNPLPLSA